MYGKIKEHLQSELQSIEENGIFKTERIITSPQGAEITISTGEKVLNFCFNNYLGPSSHSEVIQAAKDTMDSNGFGMSFVRFICGAQDIHKTLEKKFLISMGLKIRFYMLAYELGAIFKLIVPDGFFPFGSNGQIKNKGPIIDSSFKRTFGQSN